MNPGDGWEMEKFIVDVDHKTDEEAGIFINHGKWDPTRTDDVWDAWTASCIPTPSGNMPQTELKPNTFFF